MPLSYRIRKRCTDIALSFIVAGVLLPFMPYIIYMIKRESPGPIFFKQARTGLNGKTFMMYKFRTMHVNKEADTKLDVDVRESIETFSMGIPEDYPEFHHYEELHWCMYMPTQDSFLHMV